MDREQVIKFLPIIKEDYIMGKGGVGSSVIDEAIRLLKEQEPIEPDTDSEGTCSCGNCGTTVGYYPVGCDSPIRSCKFCPECGRAVYW